MFNRELKPATAFMSGKLKLSGKHHVQFYVRQTQAYQVNIMSNCMSGKLKLSGKHHVQLYVRQTQAIRETSCPTSCQANSYYQVKFMSNLCQANSSYPVNFMSNFMSVKLKLSGKHHVQLYVR